MPSASDEKPQPPSLLQQFRAKTIRQKIHPREMLLLIVVCAHLVFLPWALGGMREWGQWIALALGLVGFAVALTPRDYEESSPGQAPFRLYTWPKLIRFPIFWIGLAFLTLIAVQALNPGWVYATNGKFWWITRLPHVEWLPSGMRVPFERGGPWRMLLIYAPVWLSVCAVWIGFTRRRTFQTLFAVLATNAFLLAGLGIAQRATGATKMFWLWTPPAGYFVSSFTYKNHAGAYFDLMVALCAGLAFWYYERSQRRLDKSGPSGLFAFFGTTVAMIVIFSYSRSATALLFAFLLLTFGIFIWRLFIKARPEARRPLVLFIVVAVFGAFIYIGLISLQTGEFVRSVGRIPGEAETMNGRTLVARATWDMAQAHPISGWGAGSFRFGFPIYQKHYSEIFAPPSGRLYWEHAHNDYLEFAADFGGIGAALAIGAFGFALWRLLAARVWSNPLALFLCLGCAMTLVHCWVDFNFHNPAILTTWAILLFATIRWVELEEIATGI